MDHEKQRENWKPTFPSSPFSPIQFHWSPYSSTLSALNNTGIMRIGGLWSTQSCTSVNFPSALAGVLSMGCSSSGWSCSNLDSHMSWREITASPWSPRAVGAVPVPEDLFHLLWNLCSRNYSSLFYPTVLTPCAVFTLLWIDFPRAATSLADGCSGFYLVSVVSSTRQPLPSPHQSSPAVPSLPASRHGWTQAPHTPAFH